MSYRWGRCKTITNSKSYKIILPHIFPVFIAQYEQPRSNTALGFFEYIVNISTNLSCMAKGKPNWFDSKYMTFLHQLHCECLQKSNSRDSHFFLFFLSKTNKRKDSFQRKDKLFKAFDSLICVSHRNSRAYLS